MRHRIIESFTGPFAIIEDDDGSVRTTWVSAETRSTLANSAFDPGLLPALTSKLERYFEGEEVDFADVPPPAGDGFYQRCWEACRTIPRGQTWSYRQLAEAAGSPEAARAAGQAMRNNPLSIIVPCHRVIGSGGELHGFGGTCNAGSQPLSIKAALLTMERKGAAPTLNSPGRGAAKARRARSTVP